jgi:hypothetical protein
LHICMFAYFIFACWHISKNAAGLNSMYSVGNMFHRTEGDIKRASDFLSWISVGRLWWDEMGWDWWEVQVYGWEV